MHYSSILQDVASQSDELLQHFVHDLYQRLTSYLHWPFLLCLQLYIIVIGYGVLNGWFVVAWRTMSVIFYKLVTAVTLMTHWDLVNTYIVKPAVSGSNDLVGVILNASPGSMSSHQSMIRFSQDILVKVATLGLSLWHAGSWLHYSRLFAGLCVWASGLTVILYGFIQMLIAHMILYVMLALLPLFIILSLFRRAASLTWRWASICVSSIMLVTFMATVMSLCLLLMQAVLMPSSGTTQHSFRLIDVLPMVVVSSLCFVVMKRVVALSSYVAAGLVESIEQYVGSQVPSRSLRKTVGEGCV